MYGTQATKQWHKNSRQFENDVKMYGTQALGNVLEARQKFENDVKMYGTQANIINSTIMQIV